MSMTENHQVSVASSYTRRMAWPSNWVGRIFMRGPGSEKPGQGHARCGLQRLPYGQTLAIKGDRIGIKAARHGTSFFGLDLQALKQSVRRGVTQFAVVLEHVQPARGHFAACSRA